MAEVIGKANADLDSDSPIIRSADVNEDTPMIAMTTDTNEDTPIIGKADVNEDTLMITMTTDTNEDTPMITNECSEAKSWFITILERKEMPRRGLCGVVLCIMCGVVFSILTGLLAVCILERMTNPGIKESDTAQVDAPAQVAPAQPPIKESANAQVDAPVQEAPAQVNSVLSPSTVYEISCQENSDMKWTESCCSKPRDRTCVCEPMAGQVSCQWDTRNKTIIMIDAKEAREAKQRRQCTRGMRD